MNICDRCNLKVYSGTNIHTLELYSLVELALYVVRHNIPPPDAERLYRILGKTPPQEQEDLPLNMVEQ